MYKLFIASKARYSQGGVVVDAIGSFDNGGAISDDKTKDVAEVSVTPDPKDKDAPATLEANAKNPEDATPANETNTTVTIEPVVEKEVSEEVPIKSEDVHDGFVQSLQIDEKTEAEQIDIPSGEEDVFENGGAINGWHDISDVVASKITTEKTSAFGNPDKLKLKFGGKVIASFYYNLKGYCANFYLKNKEDVQWGFGKDRSEAHQLSDFKKALKEGFVFIKSFDKMQSGGVIKRTQGTETDELKKGGAVHQTGKSKKKIDETIKAKLSGYRYTDKLAKKLGVSVYAKPTHAHIAEYINNGVYYENRKNRSDIKPSAKLKKGGFVAGAYEKYMLNVEAKKLFDKLFDDCTEDEKKQVHEQYQKTKVLYGVFVSTSKGEGEYVKQTYDFEEAKHIAEEEEKKLNKKKVPYFHIYVENMETEEKNQNWSKG